MKRLSTNLFILFFMFTVTGPAYALNYVINGDFETLDGRLGYRGYALDDLATNNNWDVYNAIPGWNANSGDAGIEIEHNTVVGAHSGNHFVELDSHNWSGGAHNSSMYQWINLTDPGTYALSLFYRARTNLAGDNGINVYFDNELVDSLDGVARDYPDWQEFSYLLNVDEGRDYQLMFSAFGTDNSLGGFLDSISLSPVSSNSGSLTSNSVPEPSTLFLLSSAMIGLIGFRRRKR